MASGVRQDLRNLLNDNASEAGVREVEVAGAVVATKYRPDLGWEAFKSRKAAVGQVNGQGVEVKRVLHIETGSAQRVWTRVESSAMLIKRVAFVPSSPGIAHHGAERPVGNAERHIDGVRSHDGGANRHVKMHGHPGLMLGSVVRKQEWCRSCCSTVNDGQETEGLETRIRQQLGTCARALREAGSPAGRAPTLAAAQQQCQ